MILADGATEMGDQSERELAGGDFLEISPRHAHPQDLAMEGVRVCFHMGIVDKRTRMCLRWLTPWDHGHAHQR